MALTTRWFLSAGECRSIPPCIPDDIPKDQAARLVMYIYGSRGGQFVSIVAGTVGIGPFILPLRKAESGREIMIVTALYEPVCCVLDFLQVILGFQEK